MNRKQLVREYKESKRPAGVYRVRCVANGKSLVGTSIDLPAMLNRQQSQLRMGGHPNKVLQKDWDEHGAEAFEFEVLDTLDIPDGDGYNPKADLRTLEEMWLDKLKPYGDGGYNTEPKRAT
ncbi:MAG: GIY-YIG nuclease family protein [Pyrinomonadaceae bacterium]